MPEHAQQILIQMGRSIGHGAQADVFLVRRHDTGSHVVAKFLRDWWDPLQRAGFIREAQRHLRCTGPSVVPILGWNLEAQQPFILLPYMARGTLADAIANVVGQGLVWKPNAALAIIRQLASSLVNVHAIGVAHLDLKPANILLDAGGGVAINDFGVAATIVQDGFVQVWGFAGTPAYAAPEQFKGVLTPACDVWALGVILCELLTGHRLSGTWAAHPERVTWPSHRHHRGEHLDELVRLLAQPDRRYRPSAYEAVQLVDRELQRVAIRAAIERNRAPAATLAAQWATDRRSRRGMSLSDLGRPGW